MPTGRASPVDTDSGGRDGFQKAHAGDLGNLHVYKKGAGKRELFIPGLNLSGGKYNVAGRAVILHENTDVPREQPTGNTGRRIACGVIRITGK